MERTGFENLRVYNLSEELADFIWDIVTRWDYLPQKTVGIQLVKSADSIGANIAEGTGRGSFADNRRFARIARGSLFEAKHWLRRAYKRAQEQAVAYGTEVQTLHVEYDSAISLTGGWKGCRR